MKWSGPGDKAYILWRLAFSMIARLKILLPYEILIPDNSNLRPFSFQTDVFTVTVHPPALANVAVHDFSAYSRKTVMEAFDGLGRAAAQVATDLITVNGQPVLRANYLEIDFQKEEFDRLQVPTREEPDDLPTKFVFEQASLIVRSLRTILGAAHVREISENSVVWMIQYLNDDGSELPQDPTKFRKRFRSSWSWTLGTITSEVWSTLERNHQFGSPVWNTLLLDAEALLPEIGAAMVVANAALEVLIESVLEELVGQSELSEELWTWINERDKNFWKQPSVADRFDVLLKAVIGHSMKQQQTLWEGFKNLRSARNSYAHDGVAKIADTVVDIDKANELVGKAKEIAEWIESFLPVNLKRPISRAAMEYHVLKQLN